MKIPEILLVETVHQPGSLAKVLQVIADAGLAIEHLTALRRDQGRTLWEITLEMDEEADRSLYERIGQLPTARFVGKSDRVFNRHRGGKIRTVASLPINTRQVLRDVYTPGVARVCLAIQKDPQAALDFTALGRTVAIVTNGTAVLGLGNIGALAGLPVMEGKAALFAELVGINGVPILINETQPARVADIVAGIETSFGAIQLEDFAAPECFEIEQLLQVRLRKPVLHDDQHGTAVVTLAALLNAARRSDVNLCHSTVGQIGLGAAGSGIVRLLRAYGVQRVLGTDRNPNAVKRLIASGGEGVTLESLMQRADIVIATTGVKGLIRPQWVRKGQVILALSNPDPEIEPLVAREQGAAFAADGKGINNVLAFPGLFKGALEARARRFSDAMLMAAANAIAGLARGDELVPDPLDKALHEQVAAAVKAAAGRPRSPETRRVPREIRRAPRSSVRNAETPIGRGEEPQRTDEQKLQVLEEGRALALHCVAHELPDPGDDEYHHRGEPQRPGQLREALRDQQQHREGEEHAHGERRREQQVIDERRRGCEGGPVEPWRGIREHRRHLRRPQEAHDRQHDGRHADPVQELVDGVLVAHPVLAEPVGHAAHARNATRGARASQLTDAPGLQAAIRPRSLPSALDSIWRIRSADTPYLSASWCKVALSSDIQRRCTMSRLRSSRRLSAPCSRSVESSALSASSTCPAGSASGEGR